MSISLYRRYRPQKFSEVTGQTAAVAVVAKSLERSAVGHAYLFSGPRGCGKTTVARLMAKALNCMAPVNGYEPCCECSHCLAITGGESLDVIEIDGASNNGVNEVRELKSHVTLVPFSSRYKIYIIDEVHMLSIPAFNALLKTLEEPPASVVFILATTEAHKVPVTIRSRCQHIPFHRIGVQEIYDRLVHIASLETLSCAPEALWEIARQADGALRDALSMLEQVAGLRQEAVTLADVETALGQGSRSSLERWVASWRKGEMETFVALNRMLSMGASPQRFVEELFSLVRNLWLVKRWENILNALNISEQEKEYLKTEAPFWKAGELESIMGFLSGLLPQVHMGMRTDVLSGLLMTKMTHVKEEALPQTPSVSAPLPPREKEAKDATKDAAKAKDAAKEETTPEPLDVTGWEPYAQSEWNAVMDALREKEFLLYCGLIEAQAFRDFKDFKDFKEGKDENNKKNEKKDKKRLILDIRYRYCYEVLKLERNRAALKIFLASQGVKCEIILRHGALWTACEDREEPSSPEDAPEKTAAGTDLSSLEPAPMSGVPFDGLVRGVTRWLRGEVILVRRSQDEDDIIEENSIEE